MKKKETIHSLRAAKGKRQLTEIFTTDPVEAAACEAAGIDLLVTLESSAGAVREAAPNTFLTVAAGINDPAVASEEEAIRTGFRLMQGGADAIYTGLSVERVKAMAREHIPVVGHTGYVPYRSSWTGGARAVGKRAAEAVAVYRQTMAYQEAGAIAVEMEIVPEAVAAEISRSVNILVFSMGSGAGCDAQYLFATDILGTNSGHVPRHAKKYADLQPELDRLQQMRIKAFQQFRSEVDSGAYPGPRHSLKMPEEELQQFRKMLGAG